MSSERRWQLRQPHSEGRAYFDRKVVEGKTRKEVLRSLERQVSTPFTATPSPTPPEPGADSGPGT